MTESGGRGIADAFRNRRADSGDPGSQQRGERATTPARGGVGARRRRQKTGKRSNPNYVQISALVTKDVKARFAVAQAEAAYDLGRKIEFGELINMLMAHFAVGAVSVEELEESLAALRPR